ncbi:hypothetical protein PG1C_07020 [Rugosibacter aromaticivorans]|uniref:Uncharacterized protein n=1 Tax=Rugosibacter aromaticivorans TaxID=1565605 RepID=A0A0C5IZQ1_9PROT|nr:hypothetical protein [Rugosibacter aromaticivorans]AJP48282.1 hypothetical protein PG1C_07020 [Rugosibacter aromaticivorans]TBR15100.1 MAG: hypothetical protein EPO43_05070 [Rugosibacter sp.]
MSLAWCAHIGYDVPPELAALAKAAPQAAPKVEAAPLEQAAPAAKVESESVARTKTNKKKWGDEELRALWDDSNMPGVSQISLAKKHGVTRQRIGKLLKKAKEKFSVSRAMSNPFSPQPRTVTFEK